MKRLSNFMDKIFPWPARPKRKNAIDDALKEKAKSERKLREAEAISRQLDRIIKENHFAENLVRHLRESR